MRTLNRFMMVLTCMSVFGALAAPLSFAQEQEITWNRIIGIELPQDQVGGISGGSLPWYVGEGFARINLTNGETEFFVRDLVLAAGNFIGTPGPVNQVKGTLVCDPAGTAGGPVVADTDTVALSERGNAFFQGSIQVPQVCYSTDSYAFLVRTGDAWIANGVELRP